MTPESLKTWIDSGREFLAAEGSPSTANNEQRTVDCIWYSGADVSRTDWMGNEYSLRFDPNGADLSLLNSGAPVLDTHASYGAKSQMGRVERAWALAGKYLATLRFSKRPEVDGLWSDIRDGIVSKFSMGVELLEVIENRNTAGKLTLKTATKWRVFEISVCPVPADYATTTLSAAATQFKSTEGERTMQTQYLDRQIETLVAQIMARDNCTKEQALVKAINQDKSIYDRYLDAHPEQTGRR